MIDHGSPYFKPFPALFGWRGVFLLYQNLHLHRAVLRHREVTARNLNIPVCRVHTLCTPPSFRLPSARRNTPICSVDGAFSLHSTNGRKQKSRQKALLPRPSDGYRVQNKNASIVSILTFLYGGPEGIRTHDLSDANRTLFQLSYRPMCVMGLELSFEHTGP